MAKIGAVILAAGLSKRMGKPKLLLPFKGASLISYPTALASRNQLDPIVVVGGRYMDAIQNELQGFENIRYIFNPQYESGMASSLKLGIQAVADQVDAVLIFLGDQPFVPNEVLQALIKAYDEKESDVRIIRPRYAGKVGHPILFDRNLFDQFNAIAGDQGGRMVIKENEEYVQIIDFPQYHWGLDIDTPEAYEESNKYEIKE